MDARCSHDRLANDGTLTFSGGTSTQDFGTQRAGDCNDNNLVNSQDFAILRAAFGGSSDLRADFNNDGVVSSLRLHIAEEQLWSSGSVYQLSIIASGADRPLVTTSVVLQQLRRLVSEMGCDGYIPHPCLRAAFQWPIKPREVGPELENVHSQPCQSGVDLRLVLRLRRTQARLRPILPSAVYLFHHRTRLTARRPLRRYQVSS